MSEEQQKLKFGEVQQIVTEDARAEVVNQVLGAPECGTSKRQMLGLDKRRRKSVGVGLFDEPGLFI